MSQYTKDPTMSDIVSDKALPNPMQTMGLNAGIPAIRAFKDARTARIKAIGESSQKAFSVGTASPNASIGQGTPFHSDFL